MLKYVILERPTKSISMCFYLHSSKNYFKPFSNILLKGNYEYGTSIYGKVQVTKSARQFKQESRTNKHNLKVPLKRNFRI